MADLKKSFDEVKEAATGFTSGNIMTSLQKDVSDAMQIGDIDKPKEPAQEPAQQPADAQIASAIGEPVEPTTPAAPTPETFVEAETHVAASEPLAITREVQAPQDITAPLDISTDAPRDAKAS
jgi:sec-independent protein translocase protein TatB